MGRYYGAFHKNTSQDGRVLCCEKASATSSAANYRAACRGKSPADFINKLRIVEEELDESMFWMEFIIEIDKSFKEAITPLYNETNELLSIVVASIKTVKNKT